MNLKPCIFVKEKFVSSQSRIFWGKKTHKQNRNSDFTQKAQNTKQRKEKNLILILCTYSFGRKPILDHSTTSEYPSCALKVNIASDVNISVKFSCLFRMIL